MSEYAGQQYVGIDLHRRRSVVVRTTESGERLEAIQILNDVDRLNSVIARAGEDPEVVLEATYGWYWAVDALQAAGARVHLAHPLGVKAFEYRRVKNDLLTELLGSRFGCCVPGGSVLVRFAPRDRRRRAAGLAWAGGAAGWVA